MNLSRCRHAWLPVAVLFLGLSMFPAWVQAQVCSAAPAGILSWISADSLVRDLSGNGRNGTLVNGPVYAPGRAGPGLRFDGVDDHLRLPNDFVDFYTLPAYSIELWFRTTAGGVIFGEQAADALDPGVSLSVPGIYVGTDGVLRVETFWAGGIQQITSPARVDDGQWNHVAATFDGQTRRAYLNGTLIGQNTAGRSRYASNLRYQLGTGVGFNRAALPGTPFYSFAGDIDEFTVYDRALSHDEIIDIVNAASSGKCLAPLPYLQRSDSPFVGGLQAGTVVLEDCEDGVVNLPGASVDATCAPGFRPQFSDSVDGDDGVVDGSGSQGVAFYRGSAPITVTFAEPLPTAAGLVWTDLSFNNGITFQAFDSQDALIANATATPPVVATNGNTSEDRFFGVRNAGGIARMTIANQGDIEIDHVQFGQVLDGIRSPFNTDDEGWQAVDYPQTQHNPQPATAAVQYEATAGNPPGDIRVPDPYTTTGVAAPARFLGDKSAFYGGQLRYDINVIAVDAPQFFDSGLPYPGVVLNAGTFSLHRIPTDAPTPNTFTTVTVPLTEAGWVVNGNTQVPATEAQMRQALAALSGLYLLTEYNTGPDDTRIDNVELILPDANDLVPEAFSFGSRTGVVQNREQVSPTVTITGIGGAAPITVSGGRYSINGGAATSEPGTIRAGDRVNVRHRSSADSLATVTTTLTIGGLSASYATTTRAADEVPDPFDFGTRANVSLGARQRSVTVGVSGLNVPAPISVTGGSYAINGGAPTTAAGTIRPGDRVSLSHSAAASPATTTTTRLNIGGVIGSFATTTVPADRQPDAFGFTARSNVPANALVESGQARISGINAPAPIAVNGGEYRINGGSYTAAAGTINAGDSVQLRLRSAAAPGTRTSAVLSVGGVRGAFSATTAAAGTITAD